MVTVKLMDGNTHEVNNIGGADSVVRYFQEKIDGFRKNLDHEDLSMALEAAKKCNEALAILHENEELLKGIRNQAHIEATRSAVQEFLDFDPSA
jgi:hypothetical protein